MERPNTFSVIPAPVRYSKELSAKEKLLYAEISALCGANGICTANNAYFASLYKVTHLTVMQWLSKLQEMDFIKISWHDQDETIRSIKLIEP